MRGGGVRERNWNVTKVVYYAPDLEEWQDYINDDGVSGSYCLLAGALLASLHKKSTELGAAMLE